MEKKKFKISFKLGLLVYTIVGALLILFALTFFWKFIKHYEDSMPVHTIDKLVKEFEKGDVTELFEGEAAELSMISEFNGDAQEQKNYWISAYNEYIKGKKITYIKAKDYTEKKPIYVVKADDVKIAEISLKPSKKRNGSNFKIWEYDSISISDYISKIVKSTDVKVQVPEGTVVTLNGVRVGDSYQIESTEVEELKIAGQYMTKSPKLITYEIKSLFGSPEIKATLNEQELELVEEKGILTGTYPASEEFEKEMEEYVDKVVVAYAKNFINVQKKILPYVMKESELYESIKSATTAWYPNSKIESYEFAEKEIDNFQIYGEDCFSCDVRYVLNIKFISSYKVDDPTETGSFKWYFVKKDDTWYLTALTYN